MGGEEGEENWKEERGGERLSICSWKNPDEGGGEYYGREASFLPVSLPCSAVGDDDRGMDGWMSGRLCFYRISNI